MADRRLAINWTVVLVAALAAVPPSLVALATYWQTAATHQLVNSRMTEMIAIVRGSATAEATLAEKAKQEQIKLIEQAAPAAAPAKLKP